MTELEELQSIVGADGVLHTSQDMAPFLTDWRGRYRGAARAVVQPRSTTEAAQLVRWCAARRAPMVPQGGNTGLVGGATPDANGQAIVIAMRRMNRVREVDAANDSITVEAGCVLAQVQQAAHAQGRLFPLSLAAEGSCTIGGNIASNAGGTQVLRYGSARELVLGLEAVLPDGSVWQALRGLRKDNSGYDLKQLFIGSEGTLGLVTAAVLRLFPLPRSQVVCLAALADIGQAVAMLQHARASLGPTLTAFELMARPAIELVLRTLPGHRDPFAADHAWLALIECSSHEAPEPARLGVEAMCESAILDGIALDAIIAHALRESDALWHLREAIPEAQARAGGNVKHDISLPVAAMAQFVRETEAAIARLAPELQTLVFGHLGDGNLHFNVGPREGVAPQAAFAREAELNEIVFSAALSHGGSFSAEHGVGQLRRDLAMRVKPAVDIELMRAIKRAIDPHGLMNPGKVI